VLVFLTNVFLKLTAEKSVFFKRRGTHTRITYSSCDNSYVCFTIMYLGCIHFGAQFLNPTVIISSKYEINAISLCLGMFMGYMLVGGGVE
jgi:hypothetical protein